MADLLSSIFRTVKHTSNKEIASLSLWRLLTLLLALLPVGYALLIWADLPTMLPTHFTHGRADGFSSRADIGPLYAGTGAVCWSVLQLIPYFTAEWRHWVFEPFYRRLVIVIVGFFALSGCVLLFRGLHMH